MNIGCIWRAPIQPSFGWVGFLTFTSRGRVVGLQNTHPITRPPQETRLGWGTLRTVGWATRVLLSAKTYAGTNTSLTASSPTTSLFTNRSGGRAAAKYGLPPPSTNGRK